MTVPQLLAASDRRVRGRLLLAAALGVVASGTAVGLAATSAWLVVRAAERPPVLHLMVAIVAVRAFGLSRGVFRYAERLAGHDAALRALRDLRVAVVRRLADVLPAPGLPDRGDLLARFVRDVDATLQLWARALLPALVAAVTWAGAVVGVALILPAGGVVLAVGGAVTIALAALAARRADRARDDAAHADLRSTLLDALDGATELRVLGSSGAALRAIDAADRRVRSAAGRVAVRSSGTGAVATAVTGAMVAAAWWFARDAVLHGRLGGPSMAVVVLLPLAVQELVVLLVPAVLDLPAMWRSARRVVALTELPTPVPEPVSPAAVPDGLLGLRLVGVAIGWHVGSPLQRALSVEIAPGAHVAVEGPSGCGKSTLAATLTRFASPLAGSIELLSVAGPVPLDAVPGDDARRAIGWAAQDAHVFDSTIAANLRLARPDASEADLWRALDRAALGHFVRTLPDGLDTMVGEHGRALSGGERQRLTLARILLSGHRIVILDEPTEHLDDRTARALLRDALGALADRTVIVLTHRPDLLSGCPTALRLRDPGAPVD